MKQHITIAEGDIAHRIYFIRGKRVMLDRDLASLYGVGTKALKQAVKRNADRFPTDFLFSLTKKELQDWRSQFVTSKGDKKGLRHSPFCFTELGVAMLSSILNSRRAIKVNIQIMRVFSKIREMAFTHRDILIKLELLEKKISGQDLRLNKQSDEIRLIFEALKQLLETPKSSRNRIGYRQQSESE